MWSLNRARARKLAPKRTLPKTKAALKRQLTELSRKVAARIGFERSSTPLNARMLGMVRVPGGVVERIVFESEPGMPIPSLLFLPRELRPERPVVVHASEAGKPTDTEPMSLPIRLMQWGWPVLSIDVRDTGETSVCTEVRGKKWRDFSDCRWRHDRLAIRALALGGSRPALRTLDVLRAVDLLQERAELRSRNVVVVGEGRGGIWALKAAAFDRRIKAVACLGMLASYKLLTENRYYNQLNHFWVPGVLLDYDIPDLPALIAPRPVWILDPIDHMSKRPSEASAGNWFRYSRGVYRVLGQPQGLIIARTAGSVASAAKRVAQLLQAAD
jgi:pimeloyl-ACP methyl ester carboxylesterase